MSRGKSLNEIHNLRKLTMRTIITIQNPVRAFRAVVLMLSAPWLACSLAQASVQTHQWSFDNDTNPAPGTGGVAEVTVGTGGVGWQASLEGLPGATGFWDLGESGQIRLALANPVTGPAEITLRFTQWYDGVIFANLLVSVPNATRTSTLVNALQATATSIGGWQNMETTWSVAAGSVVTEASILAPFSGVVDSVSLTVPTVVVTPLELTIRTLGAGLVEVSWPLSAGAAALQSRPMVGGEEDWNPVTEAPQVVGDRYVITLMAEEGVAFFRLQQ
jgi:hypothetical protein